MTRGDLGFLAVGFFVIACFTYIALWFEISKSVKFQKIVDVHQDCPIVTEYRVETETEGLKPTNKKVLLRILWWGVTYECTPVGKGIKSEKSKGEKQ